MVYRVFKDIWYLLDARQRRRALLVCVAAFVGLLLEMVGLGLIVPAIGVMTQPDWQDFHPLVRRAYGGLGNPSQAELIVGGLTLLLVVYCIKSAYLAWMIVFQSKFVHRVESSLSARLIAHYMRQPWTFHLQHHSAALIRNATTEVISSGYVLTSVVHLVTDAMMAVGIVAFLLFAAPIGTLIISTTFLILGGAFILYMRRRLLRWGQMRQQYEEQRMRVLQEALGGVRDVLIRGQAERYAAQYAKLARSITGLTARHSVMQQLPRLLFEVLGLVSITLVVVVMLKLDTEGPELLPSLAMFSAAAVRLMPSATRIVASLQWMRWGGPSLELVSSELARESEHRPASPTGKIRAVGDIQVNDVDFQYPEAVDRSVHGISMRICEGTTVGIIGPSGSGKSTLLDLILGLLSPSRGEITVNGVDIRDDLRGWQDRVGYVSQTIYLSDESLRRNIAFGVPEAEVDQGALERAIQEAQLAELVSQLPRGLETTVGERGVRLSGGQRQRIGIARALYTQPEVLVLDEATSALDGETEREIMSTIRGLHGTKTIIIVAHRLSTVEVCDAVFKLDRGQIVAAGSYAEVVG